MTRKQAMEVVKLDKTRLLAALSDLETVEALYLIGESEKAIDLYGAISSRLSLTFRSFPRLDVSQ